MNWIKENKFLFGFILVMVLGLGAGGWFLFDAKGRYDQAAGDYDRHLAELNRLQRLPIFPNQKNLEKIVAQQTDVNTEVSTLAKTLAAQQIPLEELTPEQFQDKLKAAVTAVKNKATQSNPAVKLPEPKFFLGFDPYETAPPPKEAAAVLGRELKAIEWLCNQLIDNKITELKPLNREPLPEEKGRAKAQETKPVSAAKPASGKAGEKPKPGGARYEVEKHRIDLVFVTEQSRFRTVLNAIVSNKGQFFIPRLVGVKNEKPAAPPRVVDAGAPPPPAAGATSPAAQAAPAAPAVQSTYIVGEEKIEVTLVLELVDIREGGAN
ncbi:MAG: Amuc_1100 family pilus-like protein [Chthoniobacteraceae bacterium]